MADMLIFAGCMLAGLGVLVVLDIIFGRKK